MVHLDGIYSQQTITNKPGHNKFKKFGLQKFNKNKSGCTEECEFYHPRACFEALKAKS